MGMVQGQAFSKADLVWYPRYQLSRTERTFSES